MKAQPLQAGVSPDFNRVGCRCQPLTRVHDSLGVLQVVGDEGFVLGHVVLNLVLELLVPADEAIDIVWAPRLKNCLP